MPGDFDAWIGRRETAEDTIAPRAVRQMAATLECAAPEAVLPPLWHWMGWQAETPMAGLGPDGHAKRGGFLPPVPLERRMWAGGRLTFHTPLPVGVPLVRRSEILKVAEKQGGAGRMVFVTVGHEIATPDGPAVTEEQDIVYVAMPDRFSPPPPQPAPEGALWSEPAAMDTVKMFRFSALTFNGHRIHYDLEYAKDIEKYPGLVVHGPMQAMLLLGAAIRHRGAGPATYRYRGVRPLFHTDSLTLTAWPEDGGRQTLAVVNGEGLMTMQAEIGWQP